MIQRKLVLTIVGCVALVAALALLRHAVFPDVVPYMPGEDAQAGWRREIAFLLTAMAWMAAEFSVLLSIVLASSIWKSRSARTRST